MADLLWPIVFLTITIGSAVLAMMVGGFIDHWLRKAD